jgi:hypothetical protein
VSFAGFTLQTRTFYPHSQGRECSTSEEEREEEEESHSKAKEIVPALSDDQEDALPPLTAALATCGCIKGVAKQSNNSL